MSARSVCRLALMTGSLLVVAFDAGLAQTPQAPAETPLCIYQDQGYSEGATVCPQTRFMLMCSAEGAKLVWRAVADRALADRCLRPTSGADVARRGGLRTHRIARSSPPTPPPVAGSSAKCFVFNGRRYCE